MGGYSVTDPTNYLGTPDEDTDQKRALAAILSPTPAQQLVAPMAQPQTAADNVATAQPVARPGLAGRMQQMLTGVSNPPDGGAVRTVSQAPAYQPTVQPSAVQPASSMNPDPDSSLRPGGTNPGADPSAFKSFLNPGGAQQVQPGGAQPVAQAGHSRFAHILGNIGNVALSTLAPGVAQYIPQTYVGHARQVGMQQAAAKNAAEVADTNSQAQERINQGQRAAAQAAGLAPVMVTPEMHAANPNLVVGSQIRPADYGKTVNTQTQNTRYTDQDVQKAAAKGQKPIKDDSGKITGFEDDKDSAIYASRKVQDDLHTAQQDDAEAQANLRLAGNDPNSPAYKLAKQKALTASSNASAAMIRAKAYSLNANVGNLGTDNNGNPVNGIGMLGDKPMGTRVQPQASKAMGNIAKFQDVYSSLDNLDSAIQEGKKAGVKFNTAAMAAALADPKTTAAQWATGKVNTTLSPQEQNVVITTKAMHEQIMAMRGAIGSGGLSDTQANRLIAQLPNATTPDMGYADKQLATVRGQLDRLQVGLPGVNNGPRLQAPGSPANPTSPGGVPTRIRPAGGLAGPVRQGEKVAVGPNGHQIVARGNKWVDPTTGQEVK